MIRFKKNAGNGTSIVCRQIDFVTMHNVLLMCILGFLLFGVCSILQNLCTFSAEKESFFHFSQRRSAIEETANRIRTSCICCNGDEDEL